MEHFDPKRIAAQQCFVYNSSNEQQQRFLEEKMKTTLKQLSVSTLVYATLMGTYLVIKSSTVASLLIAAK
jgi:hypothetical protein